MTATAAATTRLRFTKMHGAGNDFVVINATRQPFVASPQLLRALTDRRFGVGCDQVLVLQAASAPGVDFDYRIFNADGAEVGQCGNGARALALFIREEGLSSKTELTVQTATARMILRIVAGGEVQVDMGAPRFESADIPLTLPTAEHYQLRLPGFGEVRFGAVSMGNPHAVILVDDVVGAPVEAIGPALQAQAVFPESVNVGFLQRLSASEGRLRVYERGSGETLACGSGACAAYAVARQWGLFTGDARLHLSGGTLTLQWQGGNAGVLMTGPATTVFKGELEWPKQL